VSLQKKIAQGAARRARRVRAVVKKNVKLPRVSVFRSLSHIYAQIIDDATHKTLVSCSSLDVGKVSGDKKAIARLVGLELAKKAQNQGVSVAVFDRGCFLYHGRVKALADGLREGGFKV